MEEERRHGSSEGGEGRGEGRAEKMDTKPQGQRDEDSVPHASAA